MPTSHKVAAKASFNTASEDVNSNGKVGGLGGGGPSAGVGTNRQQNNFNRVIDAQENNQSSITNTLAPSSKKIKLTNHNNKSPCKSAAQPTRSRSRRVSRKSPLNSNAKQLNSNGTPQSKSIAIKSPAQPSSSNQSFPIFDNAADNSKPGEGAADDSALSKISDEDINDTIINGEDSSASLSTLELVGIAAAITAQASVQQVEISDDNIDDFVTDGDNNKVDYEAIIQCAGLEALEEAREMSASATSTRKRSGSPVESNVIEAFQCLSIDNQATIDAAINIIADHESEERPFRKFLGEEVEKSITRYLAVKNGELNLDAQELERTLNDVERVGMFNAMKQAMPSDQHSRINISHRYSVHTLLSIFLAYSPFGTLQKDMHCMPYWQCCIRIIMTSVTRAIYYFINKFKSTDTYETTIACQDLACTTAHKCEGLADLYAQYLADAMLMGLNSIYEYYLVNLLVYINRHTLALVADVVLMDLCASASTAMEIFGRDGIARFAEKGRLIFGLHPQALAMGHGKKECYDLIRQVMSNNLLLAFGHALGMTPEELKEHLPCDILEWFGHDYVESNILMGVLSNLASKMSSLEKGSLVINRLSDVEKAAYASQEELHGSGYLSNLLQRFKAGQFLATLARKLPIGATSFDDIESPALQQQIRVVGSILIRNDNQMMNRLIRINRVHAALGLRSELAATLDVNGDLSDDPDIKAKFVEFTNLIKIKTAGNAMQQLRNRKTADDNNGKRLAQMNELASTLDKYGELPQDAATKVKFDQYFPLTKKNRNDAMQQLRNVKAGHDTRTTKKKERKRKRSIKLDIPYQKPTADDLSKAFG